MTTQLSLLNSSGSADSLWYLFCGPPIPYIAFLYVEDTLL